MPESHISSQASLVPLRIVVDLLGLHPNTIRRISDNGELPCYRVGKSGHRRWKLSDVLEWAGLESGEEKESEQIIIYSRISSYDRAKGGISSDEDSDHSRQLNRLKDYAKEHFNCLNPCIYSDVSSGLSFTRKGLIKLLGKVLDHQYDGATLLVTHKDRLARFGTELIEKMCEHHNINVVYTEKNATESQENELAEDLLAIIHVFSSRHYAKRSSIRNTKHLLPETRERIKELRMNGLSIGKIAERLNIENHSSVDGSPISAHLVNKTLNQKMKLIGAKDKGDSATRYIEERLEIASPNTRIFFKLIYQNYLEYCRDEGLVPIVRTRFGRLMKEKYKSTMARDKNTKLENGKSKPDVVYKSVKIVDEQLHYEIQVKKRPSKIREDSLEKFHDDVLRGKWQGTWTCLMGEYQSYCNKNGLVAIKPNQIQKKLRAINPMYYPIKTSRGTEYNFILGS